MPPRIASIWFTVVLWADFAVAALISGIVIRLFLTTGSVETTCLVFYLGFPVCFFSVAATTSRLRKEIVSMQKKIDEMESSLSREKGEAR